MAHFNSIKGQFGNVTIFILDPPKKSQDDRFGDFADHGTSSKHEMTRPRNIITL